MVFSFFVRMIVRPQFLKYIVQFIGMEDVKCYEKQKYYDEVIQAEELPAY